MPWIIIEMYMDDDIDVVFIGPFGDPVEPIRHIHGRFVVYDRRSGRFYRAYGYEMRHLLLMTFHPSDDVAPIILKIISEDWAPRLRISSDEYLVVTIGL